MAAEFWQVIGSGVAGIGLFCTLLWRFSKDNDDKVRRNYQRLDEVKEEIKQEYTRRDVCSERHDNLTQAITRIDNTTTAIQKDFQAFLRKNGQN